MLLYLDLDVTMRRGRSQFGIFDNGHYCWLFCFRRGRLRP
uniref:Uncharacterized protein n=1 Tax=Nelumbo nucifera TaxID=4432 RepID=A0A822YBX2_NELNU|nr:TPA_asm: hypothetical protein HUJ06_030479 [Nelumbo nucifera]